MLPAAGMILETVQGEGGVIAPSADWLRGIRRITRDDEVFDLRTNQSTYIPLGAKHRIENPGSETLQIIEVQTGEYLGEDDIERFEDRYGRGGV